MAHLWKTISRMSFRSIEISIFSIELICLRVINKLYPQVLIKQKCKIGWGDFINCLELQNFIFFNQSFTTNSSKLDAWTDQIPVSGPDSINFTPISNSCWWRIKLDNCHFLVKHYFQASFLKLCGIASNRPPVEGIFQNRHSFVQR